MARKLDLKHQPGFDEWLYATYHIEHKTMRDIAKELQCTPATVLNHLRRCGIETRRKGYEIASEKVIAHAKALGKSRKGVPMSDDAKEKLSEAKKLYKMGHKKLRTDGYITIYYPDYPSSNKNGYVLEHIYVMERAIGRRLKPEECVHHINHIRADNRVENLRLMTRSEHARFHITERRKGEKI